MPIRPFAPFGMKSDLLWQKGGLRYLAIFAAVFLAYAPALDGGFVWDDEPLVLENCLIRSPVLALEAFRHRLFPENPTALHYRPVQTLSYQADYWLWGSDPFGYHLFNVLAQCVCGCLLYRILRSLITAVWRRKCIDDEERNVTDGARSNPDHRPAAGNLAFLLALLWSVHPAHSAAVAYIAGRADPLAFGFAASGWLLLNRTARGGSGWKQVGACAAGGVCVFCALGSRESAAVLVALFAAQLPLFPSLTAPTRRGRLAALGACGLALGAYLALRWHLAPAAASAGGPPAFDFGTRVVLCLQALGGYGQIFLWPVRLFVDRRLAAESALMAGSPAGWQLWSSPETLLGLVALALLLVSWFTTGEGRALRRLGCGGFAGAFLPISNLFSLNAAIAEHWLYLPSIGLLLLGAGWSLELPRPARRWAPIAVGLLVLATGTRTFLRSRDWIDARTFFARTIASGGDSARMWCNYAGACARSGDFAQAEKALDAVDQHWPGFPPVRLLRRGILGPGWILEQRLAFDEETRRRFEHGSSAGIPPGVAVSQFARFFEMDGRPDEADAIADAALSRGDDAWPLHRWKAESLERREQAQEALSLLDAYARKHWWHREAQLRLAALQLRLGDDRAAQVVLERADRLDVRRVDALNQIAALEFRRGFPERALDVQRQAVRKAPRQPSQHRLLGALLAKIGRHEESQQQLEAAQRLEFVRAPISPPPALLSRDPVVR